MAAAVPAAVLALLLLPATAPATVHVPITTAATAKSIPLPTPPQLVATTGATAQPAPLRPHILLLIADDYGWANAGWHSKQNAEVRTPHMNELVAQGIELNRACEDCSPHPLLSTTLRLTFNVPFACHVRPPHADQYKFCSPTRCSLQSGRLPVHVNFQNVVPAVHKVPSSTEGTAAVAKGSSRLLRAVILGKQHAQR